VFELTARERRKILNTPISDIEVFMEGNREAWDESKISKKFSPFENGHCAGVVRKEEKDND